VSAVTAQPRAAVSGDGLTVRAGGRTLVDDVSLEVQPGEWLNIVGPNGAGKTTLLRALAGLTRADGRLMLAGCDAGGLRRRERSRLVALVPQSPLVPPGMTVTEYVLLGRTAHIHPLASESSHDLDVVARALDRLDLRDFSERTVETLSGGERQRVVVARMLAQDAPIALLDEPTSALDVGHQQQVLDLVDELRRDDGIAVIATMHDLTMAGQYGDRIALMVRGRIVAAGPAGSVLTEEVLLAHYGARVRVISTDDGPIVVPIREDHG
jgi:iron complex transport system ATP-binding protein